MTHDAVKAALKSQAIEVPSWAFGNSGTRFKVFAQPGVPRYPQEKIADAAQVHAFTGVAPRVALHIPWDRVDDYAELGPRRQPRRADRGDQRERVPGRRLHARDRSPHPERRVRRKATRPSARVRRHHGRRPGPAT